MRILFIGGTGIISSGCVPVILERGSKLTLLNRGQSDRPTTEGVEVLIADYQDKEAVARVLAGRDFDVVVNWIAFTPDQVQADIEFFTGRTRQYIFISSASVYQSPPSSLPVTESTPLDNPYWKYSQDKIACERTLVQAREKSGFPFTIVRPSHTYDRRMVPFPGGYTWIDRMRKGKEVIVHGDGSSIWVLTHHRDFAKGFVGLLGNPRAVGDVFHITSDELLTWNKITKILADAAGVEAKIVHVPSDLITAYDPEWGAGLLGDKAASIFFDNSKIKRVVPDFVATTPFFKGAREIIAWYDENEDRRIAGIDTALNQRIDRILNGYQTAWPK